MCQGKYNREQAKAIFLKLKSRKADKTQRQDSHERKSILNTIDTRMLCNVGEKLTQDELDVLSAMMKQTHSTLTDFILN